MVNCGNEINTVHINIVEGVVNCGNGINTIENILLQCCRQKQTGVSMFSSLYLQRPKDIQELCYHTSPFNSYKR